MNDVAFNLEAVRQRIKYAAAKAGRESRDVKLVAVTKTHAPETIRKAYEAGHRIFGENYAQELEQKAAELPEDIEWHFVGALQSNKVKKVVPVCRLIHSVDRESLLKELNKRAEGEVGILIEVNLAGEDSKSGTSADEVKRLVEAANSMDKVKLKGLMTMPPFFDDPDRARPYFAQLRRLRDKVGRSMGIELPELSMGMTGDFEAAIEEGATLVRVGTAIFGARG